VSTPGRASSFARAIRHDRLVVASGLLAVTLIAWLYLWRMATDMTEMGADVARHAAMGTVMPDMRTWGVADFSWLFLMWAVKMVAMMLPSAAPLILLVTGTYRRRGSPARWLTAAFTGGYLAAWVTFSAVAALLQTALHRAALLSASMASASAWLAGGILIAAGVYQWLPIKNACLTHCRSPLHFLTHQWREGAGGALLMGLRHGWFCVGCCWMLMAMLLVVGVMNLAWVAVIAAFVLFEKLARQGPLLGRVAGLLCTAWGVYVLLGAA
jgi:predicted metal-binding membrane protein